METFILLPLSATIGLLIHFALRGVSILITRKHKSVIEESVIVEHSASEKNVDRHGRPTRIFIPNVLGRWPWPDRQVNPNYAEIKEEGVAWMMNFRAFSPKAMEASIRCDASLLACMAHPMAIKEHARASCDLMYLYLVIDEYSDRSTPSEVRKQKDVILDALRNPHTPRPSGEWIGGEMARQFWELTIQNATAVSQKRFIRYMEEYFEGVVQESVDKKEHRIRDVKSYIDLRRRSSAPKATFSMIELGLDIPDEVMSHPIIQEMILAAGDMVAFTNDVFSYNLEQLRGDDLHNIVTCVMHEHHTDVNGAMLWVEDFLVGVGERFHAAMAALPQWEEPLNSQVKEYCHGLGLWVRANHDWSFENERYFGNKGLEIKQNRWMLLLPKRSEGVTEIGPVHINSSLL